MATASSSAAKPSTSAPVAATSVSTSTADSHQDLHRQIRSHEIAIAELSALHSSRGVYQKRGNLFFRTSAEKAKASQQKQLDIARVKLQQL